MMCELSYYLPIINEALQISALIIGSSWALYRFSKFRKLSPKLDTNNEIEVIRREGESTFLRIKITVRNIGEVVVKDFEGSVSICDFSKISNKEIQKLNEGKLPENICLFDFYLYDFDYTPELIEPGEKDVFVKDIKTESIPEVLEMHSHIKNVHFKPRGRFFKKEKITNARSLSNPIPELEESIVQLLKRGIGNDDLFLIYRDSKANRIELTYREFYEAVLDTARFFQSEGLEVGDKIATISHNHWHTVVQYFAAWFCGLVVVPVNLSEDDQRIDYILQNAEVKLALVRDEYVGRVQSIIRENNVLKAVKIVECDGSVGSFSLENGDLKEPDLNSELDALIVFTSGTTGNPKGVVLSQRNLLEDARAISNWHGITSDTRMMCVLPIHHVNGTVVTLMAPFFVGGSVVLNQKFQIDQFFHVIKEEKVEIVSVVPTLLQYLNSFYEDKTVPYLKDFNHIICGAGPLTVNVAKNFEERFGKRIIHGYGLSETTCYSCYLPLEISDEEHRKWMQDYGYPSIGIAISANEMAIHDEQGNSAKEDERGEIVIKGVNVMKGYFNNLEANEKAFTHGWFRSGDEGFYKKDAQDRKYYFITGRIKELIIRGGINLAPLEIDEVINKAPGVKVGIAVGFENDWYGEEVGAYVELLEGEEENPQEIIEFCKTHLPHAKTPKVIVFGNEIPVTSTGKYQRRKVAHLFKEWKEVQFRKV